MTSYAEIRRRARAWGNAGRTAILVGVLAALVCVYVLFLELEFVGGPGVFTFCGALVDPVVHRGDEAGWCAAGLRDHSIVAWLAGGIGASLIAAGIAVVARTPRY